MERVDDPLDLLRLGDDVFRTLAMVEGDVKLYFAEIGDAIYWTRKQLRTYGVFWETNKMHC
jgi:hypothetical protein